MTEPVLRVALLAQREDLSSLVAQELDRIAGKVALQRIAGDDAVEKTLATFPADVVLADRLNGRDVTWKGYSVARAMRPSAPFILLAERLDEELVVSFARYNPDGIVLVHNLSRLGPAVQDALAVRRPLAQLSPRQIEVLIKVAEGRSTRDIAERLGLSAKTIESHRGAMMKRLGLRQVANLVRYAVRMGLVAPS